MLLAAGHVARKETLRDCGGGGGDGSPRLVHLTLLAIDEVCGTI